MTFNHLVLVGGGHSNVLLIHKWLMKPNKMPTNPISIISKDSHLVYSAMFPSVISQSITLEQSLIDIFSLANAARIAFIKSEVKNIDFEENKIFLNSRPPIDYSRLIINCGIQTKINLEFKDLVEKRIACPIKPFFESYKFIKSEDKNNNSKEKPFIVVGSGLAAIEIVFALRKRWKERNLILVCDSAKISHRFLFWLRNFNIHLKTKINFDYGKILLCTGNSPHSWIQENNLKLDKKGRIITNAKLNVKYFSGVFAVGDCANHGSSERFSSGILAVKAVNTLLENLNKENCEKKYKKWYPQKKGLQIVNLFNFDSPKAFAIYGKFIFGPNIFWWYLKNKIDINFKEKFISQIMKFNNKNSNQTIMDCRGCAAKIPQNILNYSLKSSDLIKFAESPEDASEIYSNEKEIILQSIDGFPALISDPWLNARITTLHACSDLWACGAKLSSAQILISIPKVDNNFQHFLFSQSLKGIKSVVDELGGKVLGGHTFESRNPSYKPYALGIDISLSVQGILNKGKKPWRKYGMKPGDILMLSRPLGVGIFFAAQMQNINLFDSSFLLNHNLSISQQILIDEINTIQNKFGEQVVNASTDITGYGLFGHLKEMIDSSNIYRKKESIKEIKVILDLLSFRTYPGTIELIRKGIKSSLFESNKKIFDQISKKKSYEKEILFLQENDISNGAFWEYLELLIDPQTCGPLLISCNPKYEKYLIQNWYKIGIVTEKRS